MEYQKSQKGGLFIGLTLFIGILLMPLPAGLSVLGVKVLAVSVLMAVWWGTEAIPIPITSLLPLVLFPMLGIAGGRVDPKDGISTFTNYSHPLVMLALGVFLLAGAIVKWNLHKRIALTIVKCIGTKPSNLVLGFTLATGFVSMWMSNVTAVAMMLPVAVALLIQANVKMNDPLGVCLGLAIPYAATIGGIATVIGTGTNLAGVATISKLTGVTISFYEWMKVGMPFVLLTLPALWYYMVKILKVDKSVTLDKQVLDNELKALGPVSKAEKLVSTVFVVTVGLWMTRIFWGKQLPFIGDETISTLAGIALFLIPVNFSKGEFLMDLKTGMASISWGTMLLLGGAMTIGDAFAKAGITTWIASGLSFLQGVPPVAVVIFFMLFAALITEITTNMIVVVAFLPVAFGVAKSIGMPPLPVLMAVTVASSFAFMFPAATPTNAIAFGSGYFQVKDMIKYGFGAKLVCMVIFPVAFYFISVAILGIGK